MALPCGKEYARMTFTFEHDQEFETRRASRRFETKWTSMILPIVPYYDWILLDLGPLTHQVFGMICNKGKQVTIRHFRWELACPHSPTHCRHHVPTPLNTP